MEYLPYVYKKIFSVVLFSSKRLIDKFRLINEFKKSYENLMTELIDMKKICRCVCYEGLRLMGYNNRVRFFALQNFFDKKLCFDIIYYLFCIENESLSHNII